MSTTELTLRREVCVDAAALIRLLGAAVNAHMLGDQERLDNLLGQVVPSACEAVAAGVDLEVRRLRPSAESHTPSAPEYELVGYELASAAAPVVHRGSRS